MLTKAAALKDGQPDRNLTWTTRGSTRKEGGVVTGQMKGLHRKAVPTKEIRAEQTHLSKIKLLSLGGGGGDPVVVKKKKKRKTSSSSKGRENSVKDYIN